MNEQLPRLFARTESDRQAEAACELPADEVWDAYRPLNPERQVFEERMTGRDWRAITALLKEAAKQQPIDK